MNTASLLLALLAIWWSPTSNGATQTHAFLVNHGRRTTLSRGVAFERRAAPERRAAGVGPARFRHPATVRRAAAQDEQQSSPESALPPAPPAEGAAAGGGADWARDINPLVMMGIEPSAEVVAIAVVYFVQAGALRAREREGGRSARAGRSE